MERHPTGAGRGLAAPPSGRGVQALNVTPLIDVLLVLLIIFMVAALVGRRTLPGTVPAPDRTGSAQPQLVLNIGPAGDYTLNGQPVPAETLATVLEGAFRQRPTRLLFIRTDPGRSYQEFVTAADLARKAGARIVAAVSP